MAINGFSARDTWTTHSLGMAPGDLEAMRAGRGAWEPEVSPKLLMRRASAESAVSLVEEGYQIRPPSIRRAGRTLVARLGAYVDKVAATVGRLSPDTSETLPEPMTPRVTP